MKIKRTIIAGLVLLMLSGLISPAMAGIFTGVDPNPDPIPPDSIIIIIILPPVEEVPTLEIDWPTLIGIILPMVYVNTHLPS